jgi:hypothetical protein
MRIAWARVTAAHRRAAVAGLIGAIGSIRASLAPPGLRAAMAMRG